MYFGVDYYPEHWGESRWQTDIEAMKKCGFNMVRVAEFAWCRLEPSEGTYDFQWLDEFTALCSKNDIKIMMGVPVRNVPAWLMEKDPTMAIKDFDGHVEAFGSRYTTCLNNKTLREQALKLSEAMAAHYKDKEDIVSWHLDNEYGDAAVCYCDNCRREFISWLKNKYGTVENLNREWGLVFWSLEINEWEQAWVPSKGNHFGHNPSLLQDYRRFTSWTTEKFIEEQSGIFRALSPGKAITTNFQSMTRYHTDYHKVGKYLDAAATNYYPRGSYSSIDLDIMRGIKNQNFWVVEQKAGAPGFNHNGFLTPEPGETRMYTYQTIAHGADMVLYFRWRPSYFGQEQLHKGILNYDGTTNRIYREIEATGREIEKVGEAIKDTTVESEVALLYSYDNRWALEHYYPHPDLNYRDFVLQYHKELERHHITVDMIHPKDNLSKYKVVIVPLLYMMDGEMTDNIIHYVKQGGTLIFTTRSGAKDEYSRLIPSTLREGLREALGIEIEEYMALEPGRENVINTKEGKNYKVSKWIDLIKTNTAEVIAKYAEDWYAGFPAITVNDYGKGKAYYVGTIPGEDFYGDVLMDIMKSSGVKPVMEAPREIEILKRVNAEKQIVFLMNNSKCCQKINLDKDYFDVIGEKQVSGEIIMEPYGTRIFKL